MGTVIIQTIILGIVEGLTEFIPVSSTAHLLLTGKLITLPQDLLEVLSISIQAGAISAAIVYFWNTVWKNLSLVPKILLGFLPTAFTGLFLYPYIKQLFSSTHTIAYALILGGIALILIKPKETQEHIETISYKQSFLVGAMQIFSFIPGMSRAGSTLIGGTLLGIPKQTIVSFSFLLAIPTIFGATFVELRNTDPALLSSQWQLIALGSIVAFIVALWSIRFFIHFLNTKPLSYFGWYRIVIGILVLLLI